MGLFGYQLLKQLNPEQQQARRAALDLNATIAQASIGVVLALIQVYYLISWASSKIRKSDGEWKPSSPYVKHEFQREKKSVGGGLRSFGRRVKWYMDEPVVEGWGSTGAWFAGSFWMAWLLALCVRNTGDGEFDSFSYIRDGFFNSGNIALSFLFPYFFLHFHLKMPSDISRHMLI
jgi:hypothetical protein